MNANNEQSSNNDQSRSILNGTEEIINDWLWPDYKTQTACNLLSGNFPERLNGCLLISQIYAQIERNWRNRDYDGEPSSENWRLNPQPNIDEANPSQEKQIEKKIVTIPVEGWVNQVPVASGLTGPHAMKKACLDLVHILGENSYEFIELKVKDKHPLYAAMEVIQYGIIYLFARENLLEYYENKPLIKAASIGLRVLAPQTYYEHKKHGLYKFEKLEGILSDSIAHLAGSFDSGLNMNFKFTSFPTEFKWPGCTDDELRKALQEVGPLYGKRVG